MKSNIWIFSYLLLLVLIVFFEYKKEDYSKDTVFSNNYKIEENKELERLMLSYVTPLDSNFLDNKQWGIIVKKRKKEKKKIIEDLHKIKLTEVVLKEKTVCIEKECFKLLGVFSQNQHYYASFYNKEHKKRVETYGVGNRVESVIYIKSIKKNRVVLKDVNSTREWSIKLFDTNISKYKPKEFE